jgi:hypothetical protein
MPRIKRPITCPNCREQTSTLTSDNRCPSCKAKLRFQQQNNKMRYIVEELPKEIKLPDEKAWATPPNIKPIGGVIVTQVGETEWNVKIGVILRRVVCPNCKKLLFVNQSLDGKMQKKCRCGHTTNFEFYSK